MISRRAFLTLPALATFACRRNDAVSSGYAFIANQDGGGIAAIDLDILAVAKHIPIEGAPTQVISSRTRPSIYALTPVNGMVHEIHTGTLKFARKLKPEGTLDLLLHGEGDDDKLYAVSRQSRSVAAIDPDKFTVVWRLHLPEEPIDFTLSPDGKTAAVSSVTGVRLVSLRERSLGEPLGQGNFGKIRFLTLHGERLVAADLDRKQISVYRVANPRLVAHLPIAVRPEHLCFNSDGGQLFVTGPGADAVVVLYPYDLPEVAETILVGHGPAAMAASQGLLFITNPSAGSVTVLHVGTHKVISVVPVGNDPGTIGITPDDQFALVLNRESGNVAVLNVQGIQPNRSKPAPLVTIVPVGARPVSAAMHA